MKIICYALIWIGWLAGSALASSGGSSSGGGELLEDSVNPWFLSSAQNVTYCISRAADFSVTEDVLQQVVKSAFAYWEEEFSNAYLPDNMFGSVPADAVRVRVKSSGFIQRECSDNTDLAFQFGTLSESQRQYVADHSINPRRYVAFTGRLAYDRVSLRGKGFVYVSPDRGANAFQGDNVVENAWTENTLVTGTRLGKIVTHELGHVFGLSHMGGPGSLMDQDFPEMIVSKSKPIDALLDGFPVFYPREGVKMIGCASPTSPIIYKKVFQFFGIPASMPCFAVSYDADGMRIRSRIADDLAWTEVGRVTFFGEGQRRYERAVSVWLTPEQTVFPGANRFFSKILMGPALVQVQRSGTYISSDGSIQHPVFIQADSRHFQLGGVVDGQMWADVLSIGINMPMYPVSPSGWVDPR